MRKYIIILIFLLIALPACKQKKEVLPGDCPNIVIILTDDQGYGDIGFYDNPYIKTPFLDSLASISTRFNQFYVCPVCAPTRAGLMTGRYALRTGVYDTYNGGAIMHSNETTLAEILKDAGYETGIFGKWHLGDSYPFRPGDQGFNSSLVHRAGGIGQPGDNFGNFTRPDSSYFNPVLLKNSNEIKSSGYCSDVFTQAAIEFIGENQSREIKKPFFLYLPFNAPHTPLIVPEEYLDLYKDLDIRNEDFPEKGIFPEMNKRDKEDAGKVYAMVTNIDDNLKKLFNKIEDLGLIENTIILFLSDNGPQQPRYTNGLRDRKGSVYEGGIRVPSFWYWKGHLTENYEINDPAANIDVLPTILDLCNIDIPAGLDLDGKSLVPLLKGLVTNLPERTLFFEWQRGFTEPYRNIAVRKGDFKMVGNIEYFQDPSGLELYDIADDPYESNNISQDNQDKLAELKTDFDEWYQDVITNKKLAVVPRIIIGTAYENPVILNRNDWKGPKGQQWQSADAFGYWDVTFAEDGLYDVDLVFGEPFNHEGRLYIRAGTVQRSIDNKDISTNKGTLREVPFRAGDYMVEAWYDSGGAIFTPIFVELKKTN